MGKYNAVEVRSESLMGMRRRQLQALRKHVSDPSASSTIQTSILVSWCRELLDEVDTLNQMHEATAKGREDKMGKYDAVKIYANEVGPYSTTYAMASGAETVTTTALWDFSTFHKQTRDGRPETLSHSYKLRTTIVAKRHESNSAVLEVFCTQTLKWNEIMRLGSPSIHLYFEKDLESGAVTIGGLAAAEAELMRIASLILGA